MKNQIAALAGKVVELNKMVEGTFDGRYGCRKCFCVTFDKSNKTAVSGERFLNIAMSGVNKNYVSYLALKQRRGEKTYDKTNNQWHDRSRLTGS